MGSGTRVAVKQVRVDFGRARELARPAWVHRSGVIVRRPTGQNPRATIHHDLSNLARPFKGASLADPIRETIARPGELTLEVTTCALVDDIADA